MGSGASSTTFHTLMEKIPSEELRSQVQRELDAIREDENLTEEDCEERMRKRYEGVIKASYIAERQRRREKKAKKARKGKDHDNDSKYPIHFYDLEILRRIDRFPRSPEDRHYSTPFHEINREKALFVYLSHVWIRPYKNSDNPGYSSNPRHKLRAHPDTPDNDKLKLIVESCDKIITKWAPEMKCYIWIDYGCVDQNNSSAKNEELKRLNEIISACDIILTPLFEPTTSRTNWYEKSGAAYSIINWFEHYASPSWKGFPNSYLERAWCRVEMMLARIVPLYPLHAPNRVFEFKGSLHTSCLNSHRPHIIYGTNEHLRGLPPIMLQSLPMSWFAAHPPESGYCTIKSDRFLIKYLVDLVSSLIDEKSKGYIGDRKDGKREGWGTYTYSNGDVYEGQWKDDMRHGKGTYKYHNGDVFEGEFAFDKRSGLGTYRFFTDQTVFEDEFYEDLMLQKQNKQHNNSFSAMRTWLRNLGAELYLQGFIAGGYDEKFIAKEGLTEDDLNCVGVPLSKVGLRRRLLDVNELNRVIRNSNKSHELGDSEGLLNSPAIVIRDETTDDPFRHQFLQWLRHLNAAEYFARFVQAGYIFPFIATQGLTDDDLNIVGVPESKRGIRRKLIEGYDLKLFFRPDDYLTEGGDNNNKEGEESD